MREYKCGVFTATFSDKEIRILFKPKMFTYCVPPTDQWDVLEITLKAIATEKDREFLLGGFFAQMVKSVISDERYPKGKPK